MYYNLSCFYKKYSNVKTLFYRFNNDINDDYSIIDDILLIKGTETFLPGILEKTIKAFDIVKLVLNLDEYQYIIRSNISTVINFSKLSNILINSNFDYAGILHNLSWIDPPSGIYDQRYYGLEFMTGTCIIMSNKLFNQIIINKHLYDKTVIDDVAIGLLIRDHLDSTINVGRLDNHYLCTNRDYDISKLIPNYVMFRNKIYDRNKDIKNIKLITETLNNNNDFI